MPLLHPAVVIAAIIFLAHILLKTIPFRLPTWHVIGCVFSLSALLAIGGESSPLSWPSILNFSFLPILALLLTRLLNGFKFNQVKLPELSHKRSVMLLCFIVIFTTSMISLLIKAEGVGNFYTVDEGKWITQRCFPHSPTHAESFLQDIRWFSKPGLTAGSLCESGLFFSSLNHEEANISEHTGVGSLLARGRLPFIAFTSIAILAVFFLVFAAFSSLLIATLSAMLIALSPLLLSLSRIINPDAIGWIFFPCFILSTMLFVRKRSIPWLIISSCLFTLGTLNKFSFFIALPMVAVWAILNCSSIVKFKCALRSIAAVATLGIVLCFAIYPYFLLSGFHVLYIFFGNPFSRPLVAGTALILIAAYLSLSCSPNFFRRSLYIGEKLVYLTFLSSTIYVFSRLELFPLAVYKQSDIVTGGIFLSNFFFLFSTLDYMSLIGFVLLPLVLLIRPDFLPHPTRTFITAVYFGLLLFFLGSEYASELAKPRYTSIFYPFVFVAASAFVFGVYSITPGRKLQCAVLTAVFFFVLTISSLNLYQARPVYAMYANAIIGENQVAWDGEGEQASIAAFYLNAKYGSQAPYPKAFHSYNGFEAFYKGESIYKTGDPFEENAEYFVFLPEGGRGSAVTFFYPAKMKDDLKKRALYDWYRYEEEPEYQIMYNNVPVVKVVKRNRPLERQLLRLSTK